MARKPTEFVQFKLRIREGVRRDIEREAKRKAHSTNQEAVLRLEQSFEEDARRASEKLHIERDAEVLNLLVGRNQAAADLLRNIVFELQSNPKWDEKKATRKKMADHIHAFIYPPEVFEGNEQ